MFRRTAFSLVELIVVIGIIAMLIAMLMPALTMARRSATAVKCASNLHQIGSAIYIYANNNAGQLPPWTNFIEYPNAVPADARPPELSGWTEKLTHYFGGMTPGSPVYRCEGFPEIAQINYFLEARWIGVHTPKRHFMKLGEVKLSSQFVLSGDSTGPTFYQPPFGTVVNYDLPDCDKDDATQPCLLFAGEPGGMNVHPGGNNVLFYDGHVAIFRRYVPGAITYHPTRMQNWKDVTPD